MLLRNSLGTAAAVALTLFSSLSSAIPAPLQALEKRGLRFDYGGTKVQGVNLGGWFVLEPWITPSLFKEWGNSRQVVDEWTFCQTLGQGEAQNRLEQHWSSWITQDDINQIAGAGLNHIRVPIGYWSVLPIAGEPYVQGAYKYLGSVIDWADNAGLKVMIDLHGAPKSQNGFDNSGHYGSVGWTQGKSVGHTLKTLAKLRKDFGSHPAVSTIEALNEPMGPSLDMDTVNQFYYDAWGKIVKNGKNVAMTFHDAFQGVTSWNNFGDGMKWLILDTHHYEIFEDNLVAMSPSQHVNAACHFGSQMASNNKWTVAGEWTGAQTDCAKWLNGVAKGARYDGTFEGSSHVGSCAGKRVGTVKNLSSADKKNIRSFIEAQLDGYEKAAGWIFWTWKTESAPEWHMKDLLANGLFPQPLNDRQYPGQCG